MADVSEPYSHLKAAIDTGEIIGIVYHGGSQPGAYREIIPLQIVERQVRARCRMSNKAKVFNLDKIEFRSVASGGDEALPTWDASAPPPVAFATVAEIEAAHRAELEAIGWHVVCVTEEDGDSLCLHRWTKNRSRPLKGPTVVLSFTPQVYDIVKTPEGGFARSNPRESARPWALRSPGSTTGTWKIASKAVEALLREAETFL